jgi:AraC-like DNA-binding protein
MRKEKTFAMAADTKTGTMLRERPSEDRAKRLDTTSRFFHRAPKRRKTMPDDDFTPCPLHLNLNGEGTSASHTQPLAWRNHPTNSLKGTDRLRCLIEELYQHDPHAADQLSNARTEQEFLSSVCRLFDLSRALSFSLGASRGRTDLADAIAHFMSRNLHRGPTLETLAQFLGYSEKYCSDLFRSTMRESFSGYLKRRRTERATTLLITTDQSVAEIASVLGFSDQFTFSHFFKRSLGQSPRAFRATRTRRRPVRPHVLPLHATYYSSSE